MNPYKVVEDFEAALCEYTGAPHAVAVSSCTIALEMVCSLLQVWLVTIPKRTYASVPQAIIKAGGTVHFTDLEWRGAYRLEPYPIWDCAPRFTRGMYLPGAYQCLSFHRRKILGHTQGGAILLDNWSFAQWLREARHDGRKPGRYEPQMIGWHAVMDPGTAAELLAKADIWDRPHEDMPCDNYPDLSVIDWKMLARDWFPRGERQEDPLYTLRDANNRLFVKAWRRLEELDPQMWKEYQRDISANDRKIADLMAKQCK
jgi:hypothetical protein